MQAARVLRQRVRPQSADPHKYHAHSPSPFWKRFRDRMVINPELSSGIPLNEVNRFPHPGSIPELYVTPASKASDVADNSYYNRDFRRMYPKLEPVTQGELATLLLAAPDQLQLPSPVKQAPEAQGTTKALTSVPSPPPTLSSLFVGSESAATETGVKAGWRPPKPPGTPYKYKQTQNVPHPEFAYFPMEMYK